MMAIQSKPLFGISDLRTILTSVVAAGTISMASAFITAQGDEAVVVEKLTTHDRRLTSLEEVTKSIASTQASQAASASAVAATQQAISRMLERHDLDIREIRSRESLRLTR